MTDLNLTPKQINILTRVRDRRLASGFSPTMQELADELGVSKVTVFEHVEALIQKGALRRDPNKARSLRVSEDVTLPDEQRQSRLPLVGHIAAGAPIEAVEQREHLDLEEIFTPPGKGGERDTFVLRVRGDSMIDAHIEDGDYVICQQTSRPRNGQTVVALLPEGEATLKKFFKEKDGRYRLQPENPAYEPIYLTPEQLQIQGIVIGVVRSY
jgi:repressor LexA